MPAKTGIQVEYAIPPALLGLVKRRVGGGNQRFQSTLGFHFR